MKEGSIFDILLDLGGANGRLATTPHLPRDGETVVHPVCYRQKTAALLYDRVWCIPFNPNGPPADMHAWGATERELLFLVDALQEKALGIFPGLLGAEITLWTREQELDMVLHPPLRAVREAIQKERGVHVIPLIDRPEVLEAAYRPGATEVVMAALEKVPVAWDESLTWDQVRQFREDTESRAAYRRFLHWLDGTQVGKPANFIADEIANKLDRYQRALARHGVKTLTGSLASVIDPKSVLSATGLGAWLASGGHDVLAAVGALGVAAASVAVTAVNRQLDLEDVRQGPDSEIAFVHAITEKATEAK